VLAQRSCKICGGTFEFERKRGGQRIYCFDCEPLGWKIVKVPGQTRVKLRRHPPAFRLSGFVQGFPVLADVYPLGDRLVERDRGGSDAA
jgi:hypothetical protein